ncbi:MAG: anhydro-N-acetylmuramic acid kinase [Gammaproteobacteria bacterium]|nr:anhydro-N-acetylmuramic acid kinase [Gammaproteobacteria bacterium]
MSRYYLGMISGTSVDGIDAVLCRFADHRCEIALARTFAYPPAIAGRVRRLIEQPSGALSEIGALDVAVGRYFADCAIALLREAHIDTSEVAAIGHHGQTIYHHPEPPEPFSWQLGDPSSIAALTGIDTVADFRRLDIALGGQGAPMVPAFHQWLFASDERTRIVLNVGGIANITLIRPGAETLGFDTGPGNTLLDHWIRRCRNEAYDDDGRWAESGHVVEPLLQSLCDEAYFSRPPPKSTGRELFNETFLQSKLATIPPETAAADIQATLLEFTAKTVSDSISGLEIGDYDLVVCGGGAKNSALLRRLEAHTGVRPQTSAAFGIDPDWVEGAAFAWLARARQEHEPGNLPTVTGARQAAVLGAVYSGVEPSDRKTGDL